MKASIPVSIAIFSYGAVFGILAKQAGLSLQQALLMSGVVFAGSAQFAALDLWNPPLPVITLLVTTLALNLRFVLMSMSLRPLLREVSPAQAYLSIFFLGDESWALTMREMSPGRNHSSFLLGAGAIQYGAWVISTGCGYILGKGIADPARYALDFVFTAAFTALLAGMWRGKRDLFPWIVSAFVALLASAWLPGKWYIVLGGFAGSIAGAIGVKDHE